MHHTLKQISSLIGFIFLSVYFSVLKLILMAYLSASRNCFARAHWSNNNRFVWYHDPSRLIVPSTTRLLPTRAIKRAASRSPCSNLPACWVTLTTKVIIVQPYAWCAIKVIKMANSTIPVGESKRVRRHSSSNASKCLSEEKQNKQTSFVWLSELRRQRTGKMHKLLNALILALACHIVTNFVFTLLLCSRSSEPLFRIVERFGARRA